MSKNVIIYLQDYKIGTGGFASIVELGSSLKRIGYNVKYISTSFSVLTIKHFFMPENNLINVGGIFNSLIFNKFSSQKIDLKSLTKILLSTIFSIFNYKYFKNYFSIIKNSDLIIFTLPVSFENINLIRKLSINSKLIYNHAGSVSAFQNYWLKDVFKFKKKTNKSYYEMFFEKFDFILFQSYDQSLECSNKFPNLSSKIIHLNPTSNEKDIINTKDLDNPYHSNKKIILNVGTICERKNQLLTIESFIALHPQSKNIELHFVGNNKSDLKYYELLKLTVNNHNLNNKVFFHGLKKDYLRYMNFSDVIILSSKAEGMPRILREAMFMRIPIIASKILGNIELISNGNGILIDDENPDLYATAIKKVLNNKNYSNKMVELAFNNYLNKYSNKIYNTNLNKLILKIN